MYRYIARVYFRKSTRYCINEFIGVCSVFLLMERHGIPSYICTSYYHGATWYYELVLVLCTMYMYYYKCTSTMCAACVVELVCSVCANEGRACARACADAADLVCSLSLFCPPPPLFCIFLSLSLSLEYIFTYEQRYTYVIVPRTRA